MMNNNAPIWELEIKVRDYECDAQGIVNNANYFHYYEVARHDFLEECGLNFFDLHQQGIDAVLSSANLQFKYALQGGEIFISTVDSIVKDSFKYIFNQRIIRKSDKKLCGVAKFEVVCTTNGRLSKPGVLDKAFARFLQ